MAQSSSLINAEEYEYFLTESLSKRFNVFIHDQAHFPYFDSIDCFSVTTGQETLVTLRRVDYSLLTLGNGGQYHDNIDLKYFNQLHIWLLHSRVLYRLCYARCNVCRFKFLPGPAKVCIITDECQLNSIILVASTRISFFNCVKSLSFIVTMTMA